MRSGTTTFANLRIVINNMKICTVCKLQHDRKNSNVCGKCLYKRNKEQTIQWKIENSTQYKQNVYKASIKRLYNLTEEEAIFWINQPRICKICGLPEEKQIRRLALDHDHATGKIRGPLCAAHVLLELVGSKIVYNFYKMLFNIY